MMVMCGCCLATYHLGMILPIIQVAPMENQTGFLGMPDLQANHCMVRKGKEETPKFLFAWY